MAGTGGAIALDGFPTLMSDLLSQHLTSAGLDVVTASSARSPDCLLRWIDDRTRGAAPAAKPVTTTIAVTDTAATARHSRDQHRVAVSSRDIDLDAFLVLILATVRGERVAASTGRGRATASDRELEVMELVAKGHRTNEIADTLAISPHTVRTHIQHVIRRLGVSSRAAAVVQLTNEGLIATEGPGHR
ncbi:MAG: helix-turn-helix transcriptional regulator [Actinomycetia bacterium]|nr:helix-turn-helix transcriptional regulator [Actinomycetes bacterium]